MNRGFSSNGIVEAGGRLCYNGNIEGMGPEYKQTKEAKTEREA